MAEAEKLLYSLGLSAEDRRWAKVQASAIFKSLIETLLVEGESGQLRSSKVVPATVAYALVTARDWADRTEKVQAAFHAERARG